MSAPDGARQGLDTYGGRLGQAGGREIDRHDALETQAVAVALYDAPGYDLVVPGLPVTRLSVNLMTSPVRGSIDGGRLQSFAGARHSAYLTPAHASARWCKPGRSRHVNVYFHADRFDDPLLSPHRWDVPLLEQPHPRAGRLAEALARELSAPGPCSALALDALARLMLVELVRQVHRTALPRALSPQALARVEDFMQAHLGERLLVRDLAAVAGLSTSHFAHAFTQATGQTPHRRLLALRLQRALEAITRTDRPLAEVAAECGFSSQQHMTQVMRQHRGITPGRLREGGRCHSGTDSPD